ncbi:MAG: hypothetical protein E6G06_01730 [Actinobacteria bacterium]|nr:MAG: hypothetical protein E6G06_01730 [Actinomycetota bacterium]
MAVVASTRRSTSFPSEPARAVCGRCLMRDECLAFALEHHERGGLSRRERRAQSVASDGRWR